MNETLFVKFYSMIKMFLTLSEIISATKGVLIQGNKTGTIRHIAIDSRKVKKGSLFIAIKGHHLDGHQFIPEAVRRGAKAVVISHSVSIVSRVTIIKVEDTTKALGDIASLYRHKFNIPVIAVTGSCGKTTTKEMIAVALQTKYKVLKNFKTENNHIGVPMTLLRLNSSYQIAVLEFGTNRFGDIRWLAQITNPTIALFTNIGESHLKFLKNPLGVFKEKTEMLRFLKPPKIIILNNDDLYLRKILDRKWKGKILTYAMNSPSDFTANGVKMIDNAILQFKVNRRQNFQLPTPAMHNVYNALAAIACGRLFKIRFSQIEEKIRNFRFPQGRQIVTKNNRFTVIDDTYNANPVSLRSALETLKILDSAPRKIFVCADMLELGKSSRALHVMIGKLVGKTSLSAVFTVGKFAEYISREAKKENQDLVSDHFDTVEKVNSRLKEYCQTGDVILVKGSRAMKMERTVEFLSALAKDVGG